MDSELDAELNDGESTPESNCKFYFGRAKHLSNDTPDKINAMHENKWQKDEKGLNSYQMKTYCKTEKRKERKPQKKCVKSKLSESNKTSNRHLIDHNNSSSASSSEDDVFQTRYSTFDKHDYEATDSMKDNDLIEKYSDEEDTLRKISNMNTSPKRKEMDDKIYEDRKYSITDKQLTLVKEKRETSLLKERKNKTELNEFFREEENSSDANIKSNNVQISDDGFNADLDFSDNKSTEKSNKKCIQEMMADVTVTPKQCSVSENIKEPIAVDEDILNDFFNGTFDVTAYTPNSSETRDFLKHYGKNALKPVTQNEGRKRKNYKQKINELETSNKRVKRETILKSNKKHILTTEEGTKELDKKSPKKTLNKDKKSNSYQKSKTFTNNTQPRQKRAKEKFDSFNININFLGLTESPHENRAMRRKNCQMKYEDAYDTNEDRVQNKYSKRKVRSSSRIASKKIKEIEKIENLSDHNEIILSDSETETNIYGKFENTYKKQDYYQTPFNLKGNSNIFKPKTDSANKMKKKHENKSSKLSMQQENGFTAMKEKAESVQNPKRNKIDKHTDDKLISRPFIHLLKADHLCKIPEKKNICMDKKNQASSLNSFYNYMAKVDQNFSKDNQPLEKSKPDIDSENSDLIHYSNRFFMGENPLVENANNFTFSKEYTKERKPKTWEMLEVELLKDLDNEHQSDSICKTVILKKEETVMKKEVARDRNLFTVSNTSMLHTISKSKTGNNYNFKYEIKNTKSEYVGSKTDPTVQQTNRKYSSFKSNAIVKKTMAAMEKCTEKFITPEAGLSNHTESKLENLSDDSETHQERKFDSHMTIIAHDGKEYYAKKLVDQIKKSNKGQNSVDFDQKDNLSKVISETQRNTRASWKAQSTEFSFKSNKSNLPTEYPENLSNYKTRAIVPYKREIKNPWENFMDSLHLQEEYQGLNEETTISNIEMKDQNESLVMTKTLTPNSNSLERNETLLIQTDYEANKMKHNEETMCEQHIFASVDSNVEQLITPTPKTRIFSPKENLSISHQRDKEKIKNVQENNKISRKLESQKINKNKELKTVCKRNEVKSPSFKFKLNKHGALKLKKHTSASSSSKSSEHSTELEKTKLHERKGRECKNSVRNKSKEKYKTYLKKLFDNQNSVTEEKDKNKSEEDNTEKDKNILEESLDKSLNNLSKTKDSLIARQEDDIFSLSSSDDESLDGSKKNYGTGPICELFDEC